MKTHTKTALALLGASAMGLGVGSAQATVMTTGCVAATSCTGAELFAGGSLTVDDKRFDGFEVGTFGGDPGGALAAATFTGDDTGADPGFTVSGLFQATNIQAFNFNLLFDVGVLNPMTHEIIGLTLRLDDASAVDPPPPSAIQPGAFSSVDAIVEDLANLGPVIAQPALSVDSDPNSPDPSSAPPALSDSAMFAGVSGLFVDSVITVDALEGSTATINQVSYFFAQQDLTPPPPPPPGPGVPEPGSLALLGLGLAGLGRMRRRRG